MGFIEIENLSHRFPSGKMGLNRITLSIKEGDFTVIAGKNGSGKTTLCRHLNSLLLPTSGTVTVDGLNVERHPAKARQIVGMVFQNAEAQIVGDTVYTDTAFGPENLGLDRREIDDRVKQALQVTGLSGMEDCPPHILSGGEKRRLAIAGILAMNPKVMVLDEPFSNLDYPGARQILQQILALHRSGKTIILVTHDLEKVAAHAEKLVILEDGKVVCEGSPASVIPSVERFGIREPCSSRLGHGIIPWLN